MLEIFFSILLNQGLKEDMQEIQEAYRREDCFHWSRFL